MGLIKFKKSASDSFESFGWLDKRSDKIDWNGDSLGLLHKKDDDCEDD